jgi:hypothetical protein
MAGGRPVPFDTPVDRAGITSDRETTVGNNYTLDRRNTYVLASYSAFSFAIAASSRRTRRASRSFRA